MPKKTKKSQKKPKKTKKKPKKTSFQFRILAKTNAKKTKKKTKKNQKKTKKKQKKPMPIWKFKKTKKKPKKTKKKPMPIYRFWCSDWFFFGFFLGEHPPQIMFILYLFVWSESRGTTDILIFSPYVQFIGTASRSLHLLFIINYLISELFFIL